MEFIITEYENYDLIKIIGRVDSYTTPQLKQAFQTLVNEGHNNFVVDMADVTYISSSGILLFVVTQKQFKHQKQGKVVFSNVSDLIYSGFALAGFDQLFAFYDDVASAVSDL